MSKVTKDGDKTIVKPDQDIVASMAKDFKGELKEILANGAKQLAIDFDDVKMIDSAGLGVLIAAHNSLKKLDTSLELFNICEDILKLLQNMQLNKHFIIQTP